MKKLVKKILEIVIFSLIVYVIMLVVGYIRTHDWTLIPLGLIDLVIAYKILTRENPKKF